jgi:hypothetical protein
MASQAHSQWGRTLFGDSARGEHMALRTSPQTSTPPNAEMGSRAKQTRAPRKGLKSLGEADTRIRTRTKLQDVVFTQRGQQTSLPLQPLTTIAPTCAITTNLCPFEQRQLLWPDVYIIR